MPLIIDGYNLLHATGITGRGRARSELERSRLALLNFIADALPPEEIAHTIVVFDAAGAPPGLPDTLDHRGLVVRFAKGYAEADELIAVLIKAETSPRRLTVVSSDHAVQREARKRRATAVDSEAWYEETERRRHQPAPPPASAKSRRSDSQPAPGPKPRALSPDEVEYWLAKFTEPEAQSPAAQSPKTLPPEPMSVVDPEEIFPPGYADDVADDDH